MPLEQTPPPQTPHSFLQQLSNDTQINNLLQQNQERHRALLIQHDFDHIQNNENLITQLLTANPFTVATHNTRNISATTKYLQLIETLKSNNIDFYGMTETCHQKGMKYKDSYHPEYTAIWSSLINRHAGVGLLIHRKWCTHIQNTFTQHDRFLYVDLYFKGHIKVRIITVYIQADPRDKQQRLELQQQLIDLLKSSDKAQFHVLIMGDFNANLTDFYNSTSRHNQGKWQYTLLRHLHQQRYQDLPKLFHNDSDHIPHTFQSPQNQAKTRIDSIFILPNFPFTPLYSHTKQSFLYLSDHLIVAAYFQNFESKADICTNRIKNKRLMYQVNKMDIEDWQTFEDTSDRYYRCHNYSQYESLKANRKNLNIIWTKLKELLVHTANKTVPKHNVSPNQIIPKPKQLVDSYTAIKTLNAILLQFRSKLIDQQIWPKGATWAQQQEQIRTIITAQKLDPIDLPDLLCTSNIRPTKRILLRVYKTIYKKAHYEQRQLEQARITHNIKLRCLQYDGHLTQMIDSLLNRTKRTIVLDRLLVKDPVHGNMLITDATTIKKLAADHYQTYAIPTSAPKPMNDRWTAQYAPKADINPIWYQAVMDPPTWDEWNNAVQSMPNGKACGPSNLHNEFFKYAGTATKHLT